MWQAPSTHKLEPKFVYVGDGWRYVAVCLMVTPIKMCHLCFALKASMLLIPKLIYAEIVYFSKTLKEV